MAEAFARAYGSDAITPASAGLMPASIIASDTVRAMEEKRLDLRDQYPKHVRQMARIQFDVVVNMSGMAIPGKWDARMVEWDVADPVGLDYEEHCEVRDEIERLVMELILEVRKEQQQAFRPGGPNATSRL
jgi:arsenate reductase